MRTHLRGVRLGLCPTAALAGFLILSSLASAQTPISPPSVYNTGAAGLLGHAVRIYHPVTANRARLRYLQSHRRSRPHVERRARRRHNH